ncbi:hypothetical protein [Thermogladius calderae]|uniref:hypothetical protein n=1 Tax=Thermogladius calderae TaxID=1200300 RepID=UPI00064F754C|nr:hypothetical protein [Thermogladius calderae]
MSSEYREELVSEAKGLVVRALSDYLASCCRALVSAVEITGQKKVTISLRGLYKRFTPTPGFDKLNHAVEYLLECVPGEELRALLRVVEIGASGKEYYIVVDSAILREVCRSLAGGNL